MVVRDDDREPLVRLEELLEPADGDDVEVVRRLVEEERPRLGGERLREEHPELEAARERRHRRAVDLRRDAEPLQDLRRPRLQRVALVAEDHVLELGVALRLERRVRLEEALLLGHRLPHLAVPHHRHVDDRHRLVPEVVLREDAEPELLRDRDDARRRGFLSREDPQQRRLPRAVRPDEPVAVARVELDGDPLEEGLRAERLAEVGDRDHGARVIAGAHACTRPATGLECLRFRRPRSLPGSLTRRGGRRSRRLTPGRRASGPPSGRAGHPGGAE